MNEPFQQTPVAYSLHPPRLQPLSDERSFYNRYLWALNPYPTVAEAIEHLRIETGALSDTSADWQKQEVSTNIYLLACGILNATEEYLRGPTIRLPGRASEFGPVRAFSQIRDHMFDNPLAMTRKRIRTWHAAIAAKLRLFLRAFAEPNPHHEVLLETATALQPLLDEALPRALKDARIGVPSPFRRLDLSHRDVQALAGKLIDYFPDRSKKLALIGLRTSGSYFVPLIEACLLNAGYRDIGTVTFEPGKRPGVWEKATIRKLAQQGYSAIVIDDPPHTGSTIFKALRVLRNLGFPADDCRVLVPLHPAKPGWSKPLPDHLFIVLPPDQWHKQKLLAAETVQSRLAEYLCAAGCSSVEVTDCNTKADVQRQLRGRSADPRTGKLKRVFEVTFKDGTGADRALYVVAKSTGWGWLGYHAFLIADRCGSFVPSIAGLRDGILFMEWLPQDGEAAARPSAETLGNYIAARARELPLNTGQVGGLDLNRHNNGVRLLEKSLSRNFGSVFNAIANRPVVRRRLLELPCPAPSAIDANLGRDSWVRGPGGVVKIDFEHHGLGKGAVNAIDPAFDIADAILNFELAPGEETRLIRHYVDGSGDTQVKDRLFLNKLMAGLWNLNTAQEQLLSEPSRDIAREAHKRFMSAWGFLTVETAKYCGRFYRKPQLARWRAPLVCLDIDGVVDQRIMGFPATTAAGVEALGLLVNSGLSIAVNTARSVKEVQAYCDAYGLAGGVAEHGGYAWNAIEGRGTSLISAEVEEQLDVLRGELHKIPGVYMDDRHRYSVRAFVYRKPASGLLAMIEQARRLADVGDGALAPLPPGMPSQIIAERGLSALSWHDTSIDTTFTAKNCNKGTGLVALRNMVLSPETETIAMGDQKPDLDMFSAARRPCAPANISCPDQAALLGCRITRLPFQKGLLEMAREVTRAVITTDGLANATVEPWDQYSAFLLELLTAADRSGVGNMLHMLFQ